MMQKMTADFVVSLAATISFGAAAFYILTAHKHKSTRKAAVIMLFAFAEVTLAHVFQISSSDFNSRHFWYKMICAGFTVAPTAFLYLALYYCESAHKLTPLIQILLWIIPASSAVLIFTNEMHGLVWNPVQTEKIINSPEYLSVDDAGVWHWMLLVYSYLLVATGGYFLVRNLIRRRSASMWQVRVLIIAAAVVVTGFTIGISGMNIIPGLPVSTLATAAGGITVALALTPYRRRELLSITYDKIFNTIDISIITVNADAMVTDMNPAAEKLLGQSANLVTGKFLEQFLPELAVIRNCSSDYNSTISLRRGDASHTYNLRVSAIRNWQGGIAGQAITLHDITGLIHAENELIAKQDNERHFSKQLAALAAITNELSKAAALDELCRMAVEAGRSRLGFDRIALWFVDKDKTVMLGTYGTDEAGRTTDERQQQFTIPPSSRIMSLVKRQIPFQRYENIPLFLGGRQVGTGDRVSAGLWDGETVIGFMSVDNLINRQPFTDHDCELLCLYASNLGHLCNLKRAQEKLAEFTHTLEQRVTERTTELEMINKELEAFTYSVSHDLRAPLRAIDGYTGILIEDYESVLDAGGTRICSVVREEAQRMNALIDALLALSRYSRAGIQVSRIDMSGLVYTVFGELASPQDCERIDFRVEYLPQAAGDFSLIRQVWVNLLSNAIKFSKDRARAVIQVTGNFAAGEVIYAVRDNGAGFDMQYYSKLFGVFQRLHSDKEFPGTGVGLAIVQRIIHRHGGRIWAESIMGKGAVFYFTLPQTGVIS